MHQTSWDWKETLLSLSYLTPTFGNLNFGEMKVFAHRSHVNSPMMSSSIGKEYRWHTNDHASFTIKMMATTIYLATLMYQAHDWPWPSKRSQVIAGGNRGSEKKTKLCSGDFYKIEFIHFQIYNVNTEALTQIRGNQRDVTSTMWDPRLDPGTEKGTLLGEAERFKRGTVPMLISYFW